MKHVPVCPTGAKNKAKNKKNKPKEEQKDGGE
jgi:hypothetical protein